VGYFEVIPWLSERPDVAKREVAVERGLWAAEPDAVEDSIVVSWNTDSNSWRAPGWL
jgi:hypothetical protein